MGWHARDYTRLLPLVGTGDARGHRVEPATSHTGLDVTDSHAKLRLRACFPHSSLTSDRRMVAAVRDRC